MAIFHFTVKMVSRGKGQSAVAKAAYNARDLLENEQTGESHDYRRHGGKVFAGLFVPEGAPAWAHDRQQLWSAVEKHETRKNSQVAREIEVALPHELTDEQRQWLVQDFVREQFVRRGLVADVAIHAPDRKGDERNTHAHILLTTRYLTPEGFSAKTSDLEGRQQITRWREQWAHLVNRHLVRHGHAVRVDHRSLKEQGIDREPGKHLGPHVKAMDARGISTDRAEDARTVRARNRARDTLRGELAHLDDALQALEAEALRTSAPGDPPAPDARQSSRVSTPDATLYDRADMVSMQQDALRDIRTHRGQGARLPTPTVPPRHDEPGSLAAVAQACLAAHEASSPPLTVPESRGARMRARFAQEKAEQDRSAALDRLQAAREARQPWNPEDVRALGPAEWHPIVRHDQAGLLTVLDRHRQRDHDRER